MVQVRTDLAAANDENKHLCRLCLGCGAFEATRKFADGFGGDDRVDLVARFEDEIVGGNQHAVRCAPHGR